MTLSMTWRMIDLQLVTSKMQHLTMIKLNRELTGRMGSRIFLQWGYQMRFSEVAKLEPYCQFYVYRPGADLHKPLTIEPDTFIVQRVYRLREFVAVGGTEVAEGKGRPLRGPSERTMSTVMELLSEKQPLVTRLVCSRWADLHPMNHVSIDEIVASLGDVAELILPAGH